MTVHSDWIEHRRGDNELIGWIVPTGEDFTTIDLLGRRGEPVDWLTAEEYLEELGIGYLAERYALWKSADTWARVKIVEVSPDGITVQEDDYGDAIGGVPLPAHRLPWPMPSTLVPLAEVQGGR
ncbi:hypothetical protein [Kocuria marina]|uniref:hypothetical protein n=1 Tax=Kocuria marina TaxID=223184 RepID=UPI003F1ED43B